MIFNKILLGIFLLLQFSFVEARILNLSDEKFASYFSGEYSSSLLKTSPFSNLVTGVDTYSDEYKVNYGGEFGFIYSSPYIAWRFSFEFLKPSKLTDVVASQGNTPSYTVTSDVTTVAPKVGLQLNLNRNPVRRFFVFGFYGLSNLILVNSYSQASVPDHEVQAKASSAVTGGGVGFERAFVDTTTISIELGYRNLFFRDIKYSKDVTTFQGSKVAGDVLQDSSGNNVELNFSSYFISVGFHFWL